MSVCRVRKTGNATTMTRRLNGKTNTDRNGKTKDITIVKVYVTKNAANTDRDPQQMQHQYPTQRGPDEGDRPLEGRHHATLLEGQQQSARG